MTLRLLTFNILQLPLGSGSRRRAELADGSPRRTCKRTLVDARAPAGEPVVVAGDLDIEYFRDYATGTVGAPWEPIASR